MPFPRSGAQDHAATAVDDLVDLGSRSPGLQIAAAAPRTVSLRMSGDSWTAAVVQVDSVSLGEAQQLTAQAAKRGAVIVGDKLSAEAREHLTHERWSWFDRRCGAHFEGPTRSLDIVFVERDPLLDRAADRVDFPLASPRSDGPIRGRAGMSYPAALLLAPGKPPSFRSIAREVGMSPTAISNAAKLLEAHGLVVDRKPSLPDLFWALADVWRPAKVAFVKEVPDPTNHQLTYELDQLENEGWTAAGDRAALELGAPLFATDDRPFFWVPTQTEMRRAQRTLGNTDRENCEAIVAVAPTPLVCTRRLPTTKGMKPWPLAHPLFLALDLARDPGRGHEILEKWKPEGIARVWA